MKPDLKRGPIEIQCIRPQIDCGRYRAKAVVGDRVEMTADIFRDSADLVQAIVRYRGPSDPKWQESPMVPLGNDAFAGSFTPTELGAHRYYVEAWTDRFGTWAQGLAKKVEAKQNVRLELEEGALLMEARLKVLTAGDKEVIADAIVSARAGESKKVLSPKVRAIIAGNPDRSDPVASKPVLEL